MSRYIAKRVALNTMKECKQPGCGCFTQKGYYIQYQNGNVDSMLFVCESCYDEKFREKCYAGDFDEERYIVKENTSRYQPINLLLRYLIRWTRKTAKTARIATILAVLILVTAFGLKEHPSIRTELSMPQLHAQLNTDVHFAFHNFERLTDSIYCGVTRMHLWRFNLHKTNAANEELVISLNCGRDVQEKGRYTNCSIIIQLKQQDG